MSDVKDIVNKILEGEDVRASIGLGNLISEGNIITYNDRNKSFSKLKDGDTFYYSTEGGPDDPFKFNGLNDVIDSMTDELDKGDAIEISRGEYFTTLLITAIYSNGNRGYTVIYPKYYKKDRILSMLKNGDTRSWRDITDSAAWLDFPASLKKPYKLVVCKQKYIVENKGLSEANLSLKPGVDWAGDIPGRQNNGVDYCYFYYHHGVITKVDKIKIAKCIVDNDYAGFKKFQHKYNVELNPEGWEYLPDYIWDAEKEIHVPLNKKTFAMINFVECENG